MYIDGTTDYVIENYTIDDDSDVQFIPDNNNDRDDVDGTGYALTTSLSISF